METARSKALKSLSSTMPVANQQVARGMQQARVMGLQSAVAAAPTSGTSTRDIQQAGAAQAAQAGGITNQAADSTNKQLAGVAATGLQEQAASNAAESGQARLGVQELAAAQDSELAKLGLDVKKRIFDDRIKFERDESGRKLLNESQLMDFAVAKSKSANEFRSRMQASELQHEKKMRLLGVAQERVVAALEFETKKGIQDRDQAVLEKLARAKQELQLKLEAEEAARKNRMAAWQAGGMIVGGVVGAVVGGPGGAVVGAKLGGAAGTAAGAQAEK